MKTKFLHLAFLLFAVLGFLSLRAQNVIILSNGIQILQENSYFFLLTGLDTCEIITDKILIKYQTTANDSNILEIEQDYQLTNKIVLHGGWIIYYIQPQLDYIAFIEDLLNEPNIENVEVDFALSYYGTPNDPAYINGDLWYIDKIQMPAAWDIEVGHDEIIVGVLDSGFDWLVEDFTPDNGIGWNHFLGNNNTYPCYMGGSWNYHGTFVSGIIAARTNNNTETCGIAGGWNSNPIKIDMEVISCYIIDYAFAAAGLYHAVWLNNARIINMSWGIQCYYPPPPPNTNALQDAIEDAYNQKGVTMFAGVGNSEKEIDDCPPNPYDCNEWEMQIGWPASSEYVIAVGGTKEDDKRYKKGFYGCETEISAPASNIYVYDGNGNPPWTTASGTSFSTAIASGVAALMLSSNPCLTNTDIDYILKQTAEKVHANFCWGYDYYWNVEKPGHSRYLGYGRIDAHQALLKATSYNINEVTSTETWSEPKWFNHDLTIKSGVVLIITDMVKFTPDKKIIVEPGAHLKIDGGTITCTCNDFWGGIEVQGNPNLSQNPSTNQGCVELVHSGKIEKAYYGIYSSNGGIIFATDAIFNNNYRSIHMENYSGTNRSFFTRCVFEWNQNPGLFGGGQYFIGAEFVGPIKVFGCTFENNIPFNSMPFLERGYGILSYNAKFIISGASENDTVVGNPNEIKTYFKNLRYGGYFLRSFNNLQTHISYSQFENNLRGLYLGGFNGSSYAQVVQCKFKVLPQCYAPSGIDVYGMYLNGCSEYTVEDNEFYRDAPDPEGIGLIINNSGYNDNMIYNNKFHKLEYGTIAQQCNRYSNQSGLCFKCNDYYNNINDIAITSDMPGNPNQGINVNQGNENNPAENTFTVESTNGYNINNPFDMIFYYHDEFFDPFFKVIPDPIIGVKPEISNNTTYNKEEDCPSNFSGGGGGIEEMMEDMNEAKVKADSLEQVLSQLVDGGSTENLVDVVQSSTSQNALTTTVELIQESPYLSDSVMKTAIINETALPNSMIRDILVANPSSAKTTDVIGTFAQRVVPMPDSMMSQIMGGLNVLSAKEELTNELSTWKQQYAQSFKTLMRLFQYDTTGLYGFDSLVALVSSDGSLSSMYDLVTLYFGKGMYTEGNLIMNSIPQQFELTSEELNNHNKFVNLSLIMQQVNSDSTKLNSLDSSQIVTLSSIAQDDRCLAGSYSRNLLIMINNIQYDEPIILPGLVTKPAWKPNNNTSYLYNELYYLKVFPNPANTYYIIEYQVNTALLPEEVISLLVINQLGHPVRYFERKYKYDQITVSTKDLPPGIYFVALKIGQTTVKTRKIVITR